MQICTKTQTKRAVKLLSKVGSQPFSNRRQGYRSFKWYVYGDTEKVSRRLDRMGIPHRKVITHKSCLTGKSNITIYVPSNCLLRDIPKPKRKPAVQRRRKRCPVCGR